MKIQFENVNTSSNTGPNHFGRKLKKYLKFFGHHCSEAQIPSPDAYLAFIQRVNFANRYEYAKNIQRLDGIYFDSSTNYMFLNKNIIDTYNSSDGVIVQSEFSKKLIEKYFGPHPKSVVINNGADYEYIDRIQPLKNPVLEEFSEVWSCASHWRGWKRLSENIRYFLEFSPEDACLIVAGNVSPEEQIEDPRIFYVGELKTEMLFMLFKASKKFIHLARYDSCPNVVIDARACGCQIVCCENGGTKEIAGKDAIILREEMWDMEPLIVNDPPGLDFSLGTVENEYDIDINMTKIAQKYANFIEDIVK